MCRHSHAKVWNARTARPVEARVQLDKDQPGVTYLPRGWLQYKAFREFPPKACNFETWSCACSPARQGTAHCVAMAEQTIETPITKLLGIRHPIILAGMNQASGPELAAAVSNAGGCAQSSSVASSRSAPRPSCPLRSRARANAAMRCLSCVASCLPAASTRLCAEAAPLLALPALPAQPEPRPRPRPHPSPSPSASPSASPGQDGRGGRAQLHA